MPDCLPGGGDGDRLTGNLDRSPVRGIDTHEDLHEGGLPGPVLAHERMDLTRVQVEGDVVQDSYTGERLVDTDHLKAGSAHNQAFCGYAAATRMSLRGGSGKPRSSCRIQRNLTNGRVDGPDKVST